MKTRYHLNRKAAFTTWRIFLVAFAFAGSVLVVNAQDYQGEATLSKSPVTAQVVSVPSQVSPASNGGWTKSSGPGAVTFEAPVADGYFLGNNRPNPFRSATEITYSIPENGKVRLTLVDLVGNEIAVIVNGQTQSAGTYAVTLNRVGLNPGVYFYKLVVNGETTDFVDSKRMVVSR